jgi:hypothetical protein
MLNATHAESTTEVVKKDPTVITDSEIVDITTTVKATSTVPIDSVARVTGSVD